jgi:hypothetical protein
MLQCWCVETTDRPSFDAIDHQLAANMEIYAKLYGYIPISGGIAE